MNGENFDLNSVEGIDRYRFLGLLQVGGWRDDVAMD